MASNDRSPVLLTDGMLLSGFKIIRLNFRLIWLPGSDSSIPRISSTIQTHSAAQSSYRYVFEVSSVYNYFL
jgi:hypothetical protein